MAGVRHVGRVLRVVCVMTMIAAAPRLAHASTITLFNQVAAPGDLGVGSPPGTFTSYSLVLNEANWHVGSVVGPNPTQSEFLSVLDTLSSLLIGTSGGGSETFLDNPNLAGLASESFPGCTQAGWTLQGLPVVGCNSLFGNPAGSITDSALGLAFVAPAAFLGSKLAAYGGALSFDLAQNILGNNPETAGFAALSGSSDETCSVELNPLTGLRQPVCTPASPVPEPASLVLLGTGMGAAVLRRRRRS